MTKNRHELPRKKPGRSAKQEIADDLPVLEPVADELPTLEPVGDDLPTLELADGAAPAPVVDDGPVKVQCAKGGEAGFDIVVAVQVPAMEKAAVVDAVRAPLQRALAAAAADLRHRKALVRFAGEAMIGSAVKDLVATSIKAHKPLLAVVRRGFGDETVAQGALPTVTATTAESAGVLRVDVATGELDAADLAMAMAPHLDGLAAKSRGKKVALAFAGKGKPDAALRTVIAERLRAAGATRAAIGERVLFDLELAQRVQCTTAGDVTTIAVTPADDEATTLDALAMVLPEHAAACRGKNVRVQLTKPVAAALAACVDFAQKHGAVRVEAGGEIVWPKLVSVVSGAETTLRLLANGRAPARILAALRAEAAGHAAATKGKAIVIDWPAGFTIDGDAEACVREVAATLQAKSVVCTVAGEQREPFVPDPVAVATAGDETTVRLDSEAGKPVELQRAIDRRLPKDGRSFAGRAVRVQVVGNAALSRTLLRSVCATFEKSGVTRLAVEEGGATEILLPAMLTVTRSSDGVRIAAMTAGRDAAQQQKALAREIDGAGITAADTVYVGASKVVDAVVAAAIAKGAARVLLDGEQPVQVHPPLCAPPEKKGLAVRFLVRGGTDRAMVERQLARELPTLLATAGSLAGTTCTIVWGGAEPDAQPVRGFVAALVERKAAKVLFDRGDGKAQPVHPAPAPAPAPAAVPAPAAQAVTAPAAAKAAAPVASASAGGLVELLARRDEAVPPMAILGIAAGTEATHVEAIAGELAPQLTRLRGRAVLLVLRANGADVPVRKSDALVERLAALVPTAAAATLVFRGPDAQGRPHFQVLHSTVRALPVGATFADPRARG